MTFFLGFRIRSEHYHLILALRLVPQALVLFSENVGNGGDRLVHFVDPFDDDCRSHKAWVLLLPLQGRLTSQAIVPRDGSIRLEDLVWSAPGTSFLPAETPVNHQVVVYVWISANEINSEPVSMDLLSLLLVIMVVDLLDRLFV